MAYQEGYHMKVENTCFLGESLPYVLLKGSRGLGVPFQPKWLTFDSL